MILIILKAIMIRIAMVMINKNKMKLVNNYDDKDDNSDDDEINDNSNNENNDIKNDSQDDNGNMI